MKNENVQKDNENKSEGGFPIQAILMVGLLGLAIAAIILKMIGIM